MRKNLKHVLYAAAIVAMIAVFAICASAAEYDYAHVKEFVNASAYPDITFSKGWVQVATSAGAAIDGNGDGVYDMEGDLPYTGSYKAYYNESKKTLVIEGSGSTQPTASSGDWQNSKGDKSNKFPYWCNLNADKVEYLEFRNCGGFNNTGYIIRPLVNVKEMKLDTSITTYIGSKNDTSTFAELKALITLGWGTWSKTTGAWSPAPGLYSEGLVNFGGFTEMKPMGTTSDVPDLIMYMGSALLNSTSVREVILPGSLPLYDSNHTYSVAERSDGSDSFPYYDNTGNVPAGSIAYRIINNETKEIAYGKSWQAPNGWTIVTAKASEIAPYNGEFSGMIAYEFAKGATALQTVTVPAGVNLHRIYKYAFDGCTSLREIRIDGTVDENFVIDPGAFKSVSNVKIKVMSDREVEIVNAALDAAGYTDRSVVEATRLLASPITADGFQVKINSDYNGLRGLFSFDESSKEANRLLGFDFQEYGVAVCTKNTALTYYSTNEEIVKSTDPKVKRIVVEHADGSGERKYVDYANRQFCIALVNIPEAHSMEDVYFVAYSVWVDDTGKERYLYTTYTASDGDLCVNLYEVTLGLFKNGLLNTETVQNAGGDTDAIIWKPLSTGAVTLKADQLAAPGTPKNSGTGDTYKLNIDADYNDDGSFTYVDQKLHSFTGATAGNYGFNPSGVEATASTNVLWSLYRDGNKYVAVYRRDPAASADAVAMLPTQSIPAGNAVHPFVAGYGALNTKNVSGDVTVYTPVLTSAEAAKVNTLILDYGIDTTENGKSASWGYNGSFALGNSSYLETIVYPNDFAPYKDSESLFRNDTALKNVIWANKPAENPAGLYHMGDVISAYSGADITSLADLRGMGKIDAEAVFMDTALENIVFAGFSMDSFVQTFTDSGHINRVWIAGSGALTPPAEKTIDLSLDTKVTKINRQSFDEIASEGYTIKLSSNVKAVVPYEGTSLDAFAITFGAKHTSVDIVAPNAEFEASFYNYLVSFKDTKHRTNAYNVRVNGKTYKEIREEICFKESQLVIYPELDARINRNFDYKVSVHQGTQSADLPVYNHTMFNAPGGRSVGGDSYRRYSMFAFCGDQVRVDIKVGCDFTKYTVIPSAKNFETTFDASTGTISVYLDKPDYFGIRLDDDDNSIISIIADMPEYPDEQLSATSGDTIYVGDWYAPQAGDGITETTDGHKGTLYITKAKNNHTLYIAPGAVLYGRVRLATVTNFSIIGRGVIVDAFEDNRVYDIRDGGTEGGGQYTNPYKSQLVSINGTNVCFDGPTLMDARCFNITAGGTNIQVRNYKAFSSMMTTDGITDGAKQSSYEHCWIYCGDNALVVSGSTDSYYNDIAIGTTCAAIFPQANVRNALLENIYVFRSNDGIINHRYNPNGGDLVATLTFRNFDCMDTINYPQFFGGGNMGTSTEKVFTFENIALPTASNITDPHATVIANSTSKGARLVEISKSSSQIDTTNYTFNFINTYVNGQLINSRDKAIISEYSGTSGNTYNFSSANNGYTPVQKIDHTVNYTASGKVYIGTLLSSFENDVIIEGSTFYLPAEEILARLRTSVVPAKVTRNGIEYIAHTALASSGAAKSAVVSGGNLTVTPVAPSASTNLIVQNSGLVTREFETTCYHIDLVQNKGDGVMYAYPHSKQYNGGIGYNITEEVKMYGAGEYTFKLKARCVPLEGGAYSPYQFVFVYDTNQKYTTANSTKYTLTGNWVEYSYTFEVTEEMLQDARGFTFYATATGSVPVDHYEVKDTFIGFNMDDTAGGDTTPEEPTPVNPIDTLVLGRGINISLLESESKVSFPLWSIGSNNNNFIKTASTYTDIKAQGFDHVRLPVNFHTYYSNGAVSSSFLSTLDTILNTILDSGLTVILDFHGWSAINSNVDANKAEFYAIWTQISERYKDYPDQLLFELLNEPYEAEGTAPLTAAKLNEIQNEAIKIVRKTNPTRIIVAAGPEWNSWWGLEDLTLPTDDPNIIVDIHTYQPYDFTHQGSERWTDPNAVMTPVPLYDAVFTEVRKVVRYCGEYTERTGIKVWLGEFGVYLYIAENVDVTIKDDITEYLAYVSKSMEDAGIPWAYWEYNSGFGAYDSSSKAWKDYVMNGLTRRSDAN